MSLGAMRLVSALCCILLAACSTSSQRPTGAETVSSAAAGDPGEVSYYDRNRDGVADLEFHEYAHRDDADWALVDTRFKGRYDLELRWSFGLLKRPVDLPVPTGVSISADRSRVPAWE
jgi:hypothetical protein